MIEAVPGVADFALDIVAVKATVLNLVAVGGLAGIVAVLVLKWTGRLPRWIAAILVPVLIAASAGSFGFLRGQESERVRNRIARLEAVVKEQERQRAAAEKIAEKARARAVLRERENETLRETVLDYESELAAGDAGACPADGAYSRRMHSIRIGAGP